RLVRDANRLSPALTRDRETSRAAGPPAGERLAGERAARAGGFPESLRCSTVPPSPNGCSINT
ncbi:hypothetical protein AAHH78_36185, partial [Burkholderia pseudomallei]